MDSWTDGGKIKTGVCVCVSSSADKIYAVKFGPRNSIIPVGGGYKI